MLTQVKGEMPCGLPYDSGDQAACRAVGAPTWEAARDETSSNPIPASDVTGNRRQRRQRDADGSPVIVKADGSAMQNNRVTAEQSIPSSNASVLN